MRRRLARGLLFGSFVGMLAWSALAVEPALAQETGAQDAADDRAQSFQAVEGGVKEDIAGGPLMLAAYAVVWLVVFGYVFRLVRLHRGLEDNLNRVERAVGAGQGKGAS